MPRGPSSGRSATSTAPGRSLRISAGLTLHPLWGGMAETARQDDAARLLLAAARQRASATKDLFLPETHRLSDRERVAVRRLFQKLVRTIEDDLRSSLANSFAVETALHAALASAHVQIAVPILSRPDALHDSELITILLRRAEEHRIYRAASTED